MFNSLFENNLNEPSIATEIKIIDTNIIKCEGELFKVCQIKLIKAPKHRPAPIHEMIILLFVCLYNFAFERFTQAKINRNPALPIVERLERSNRFANIKVKTDVIINPSIGLSQMLSSKNRGSSPSFAMM